MKSEGVPQDVSSMSMEDTVLAVRDTCLVVDLWPRVVAHTQQLAEYLHARDSAVCLEICPRTLSKDHICRLHTHVCLRSFSNMSLPFQNNVASLDGANPQVAQVVGGLVTGSSRSSWASYFYCCAPKLGGVHQFSTREPFKDFLVNANWVLNLLQSGKITIESAKELVRQCCSGSVRCLKDIALVEASAEEACILTDMHKSEGALLAHQTLFRCLPEVDQWASQDLRTEWRYKFLVLDGPSKVGKTQFALQRT